MSSRPHTLHASATHALLRAGRFSDVLAQLPGLATGGESPLDTVCGALAMKALGRRRDALAAIQLVQGLESAPAEIVDAVGTTLAQLGDHEAAREVYRSGITRFPGDAHLLFNLGTAERALGELVRAEELCDAVIAVEPDDFPAFLMRSELRRQTDAANHVDELGARLADRRTPPQGRMFLSYALGKELDDLGRWADAFRCFEEGARLRRQRLRYDVRGDVRKLECIAQLYDRDLVGRVGPSRGTQAFGFIIGLPRSGTTLTERLLAAHSSVESNEETQNLAEALLGEAAGAGFDDSIARAAAAGGGEVANRYAKLAARAGATLTLEKLPMNYLYVGAIHRALPRAPIIALDRHPLDSCLGMFRTLFGAAYPFTYSLGDLATYFAAYQRLMAHWRAVLPGRMLEMRYEDLVDDPKNAARTVTTYCGLEWEPTQLAFQRLRSASTTASAAQVRQPVSTSSVGRWRNYRDNLEPLIRMLREFGVAIPD